MVHTLLIWTIFATCLPPPTMQRCFKANESQCSGVDFVPGSDLAGEGFDITTLQHKGAFVIDTSSWLQKDKSCTLCKNPFMGGQTQKLPVSVVDWTPRQKCSMKLSSSVYQSSEALVSASSSSIENNWQLDLQIITPKVQGSLMLAGSNSKLAQYSMSKTKKDKFSFASHSVSCGYYTNRISGQPVVHPEFVHEYTSLPEIYDESSKHLYYQLIDKFGTHYISKVTLGGEIRSVTSIKECQASLQGMTADEVKMCLDLEASVSTGVPTASLESKTHHCKQSKENNLNKKSFASTFNDRETNVIGGHNQNPDILFSSNTDPQAYKEWLSSLPAHPDVLSYTLMPLHDLVPKNKQIRGHLRYAIKDYILQRALLKNCTSPCKIGVKTNPSEPCSCSCHNDPGVAPDCCPTQRGMAEVTITVIRASGLWGDYITATDALVRIYLNRQKVGQTIVINDNNSPYWNTNFPQGNTDITFFTSVKLEVLDEDSDSDYDVLGKCIVPLKSGVNNNACSLNHGTLFYKVTVKCIHGLIGPSCKEYKPSPMDAQLEKVYVSRNARPIPKDMLLEMGVLLDERLPRINQSNLHKANSLEL